MLTPSSHAPPPVDRCGQMTVPPVGVHGMNDKIMKYSSNNIVKHHLEPVYKLYLKHNQVEIRHFKLFFRGD